LDTRAAPNGYEDATQRPETGGGLPTDRHEVGAQPPSRHVSRGDYSEPRQDGPQEGGLRRVGDCHLEKFTLGTVSAPGVCSSKYGRGPLPSSFAVNTCGTRRM